MAAEAGAQGAQRGPQGWQTRKEQSQYFHFTGQTVCREPQIISRLTATRQRLRASMPVGWVRPRGHRPPSLERVRTPRRNKLRKHTPGHAPPRTVAGMRPPHQGSRVSADCADPEGPARESIPVKCPEHTNPHGQGTAEGGMGSDRRGQGDTVSQNQAAAAAARQASAHHTVSKRPQLILCCEPPSEKV